MDSVLRVSCSGDSMTQGSAVCNACSCGNRLVADMTTSCPSMMEASWILVFLVSHGLRSTRASATSSNHAEHMAIVLLTLLGNAWQSTDHMRG